jgi:hypothetical protein
VTGFAHLSSFFPAGLFLKTSQMPAYIALQFSPTFSQKKRNSSKLAKYGLGYILGDFWSPSGKFLRKHPVTLQLGMEIQSLH